jgi:hypothetical protein
LGSAIRRYFKGCFSGKLFYLGLSWSGQRERINRDPLLSQMVKGVRVTRTPEKGGLQIALCLPLKYLNGWLFGVNANRVKAEVRDSLIRYQAECYEVLFQAFCTVHPHQGSPSLYVKSGYA